MRTSMGWVGWIGEGQPPVWREMEAHAHTSCVDTRTEVGEQDTSCTYHVYISGAPEAAAEQHNAWGHIRTDVPKAYTYVLSHT